MTEHPVRGDREQAVTETFVRLAGSLARGDEVVDLFNTLAERCTTLLGVTAVGLLLADPRGRLQVVAASTSNMLHLESFQVQQQQGPCLDCYVSGEPVSVQDFTDARRKWPLFARAAELAGFTSVDALPMRLGNRTIGAVGMFGDSAGSLTAQDRRLGQAFADVASIALLQERAVTEQTILVEQLQHALDSRVVIEQAKGVVAHSGGVTVDEAFQAIRRYSRNHNAKLLETAAAIVVRELPAATVLEVGTRRA